MKFYFLLFLCFLLWSCGGSDSSSPYSEILTQPPFASVTDSIRKDPGNDELYYRRAVLLYNNNFTEPALADFRTAWSLESRENYASGISNILVEKKPDSAILFLKDALKELPKSLFLQLSLVRAYDTTGKTNDALVTCDNILQQYPGHVNALLMKSDLLLKKNDSAGAIDALEKAYVSMPSSSGIVDKLAYQYAETGNSKAIRLADSLIKKDSQRLFAGPYYIKGLYYSNINDRTKAIESFDDAIKVDHRYLNAYIEKGKILLEQKKTNEALRTFELANTVTPSFPDAWYWMGRCQEILGDKTEAKQNYEKAFELDNTFTEAKDAAEKIK
jgi:tetratricopeptide (TPR) repeat protein